MSIYRPNIFTESYIESKNILSLCFEKYLGLDSSISNHITNFIKEYAIGFALFDYKEYVINCRRNNTTRTIVKEDFDGHQFEVLIRILSKLDKKTSNETFNQILQNINSTPNYKRIDLTECMTFIVNKSNSLLRDLIQPPYFSLLLYLVDQDIAKLNINKSCITVRYTKKRNGEYIQENEIRCMKYYIDGKMDTLEEYILKRSYLTPHKKHDSQIINFYEKHLIKNNDIIYLDLNRYAITFMIDNPIRFMHNRVRIPYILDLPKFVFEDDEKYLYELISVVLSNNTENRYSSIIKEGDKYYHYLYDEIIECDDQYFNEKTAGNAIGLFYQKL